MRAIIFLIIICVQGCEEIAMDRDFPLYFQNSANHSIKAFLNLDGNFEAIYPDTMISSSPSGIVEVTFHAKEAIAGGSGTWRDYFEVSVPIDTLSLFVFHTDTLSKYSWTEIQDNYNILKRYDLSLRDLERLDFTVTYPPDASMVGVKMWPPE